MCPAAQPGIAPVPGAVNEPVPGDRTRRRVRVRDDLEHGDPAAGRADDADVPVRELEVLRRRLEHVGGGVEELAAHLVARLALAEPSETVVRPPPTPMS